MCRFLYIDRCWKSDQERMGQMLEHLAKVSKVKFDVSSLDSFHKSKKNCPIFSTDLQPRIPSSLQQEDGQTSVSGHYQLLLFPEGTNLTKKTRAKSDEFAAKTNQKPLKHLLHPRTTGFSYLAGEMRKSKRLPWMQNGLANHSFASRADCSERKPLKMFSNFRWQPGCDLRCDHCLSRQSSWNWSRSCQWKHPLRNTLPH